MSGSRGSGAKPFADAALHLGQLPFFADSATAATPLAGAAHLLEGICSYTGPTE